MSHKHHNTNRQFLKYLWVRTGIYSFLAISNVFAMLIQVSSAAWRLQEYADQLGSNYQNNEQQMSHYFINQNSFLYCARGKDRVFVGGTLSLYSF